MTSAPLVPSGYFRCPFVSRNWTVVVSQGHRTTVTINLGRLSKLRHFSIFRIHIW